MSVDQQSEWQDRFRAYQHGVGSQVYGADRKREALFELLDDPNPHTASEFAKKIDPDYTPQNLYGAEIIKTLGLFGFLYQLPKLHHKRQQYIAPIKQSLNWLRTGGPHVEPKSQELRDMIGHIGKQLSKHPTPADVEPKETILVSCIGDSAEVVNPEATIGLTPLKDERTGKRGYRARVLIECDELIIYNEDELCWNLNVEIRKMTHDAAHKTDIDLMDIADNEEIRDWNVNEETKRIELEYQLDEIIKV